MRTSIKGADCWEFDPILVLVRAEAGYNRIKPHIGTDRRPVGARLFRAGGVVSVIWDFRQTRARHFDGFDASRRGTADRTAHSHFRPVTSLCADADKFP